MKICSFLPFAKKSVFCFVAIEFLSFIFAMDAQAQNRVGTGLVPPTAEQASWMERKAQRVKSVQYNALGVERINRHLRSRGQSEVSLEAASVGQEVIPASSGTSVSNASASASLMGADSYRAGRLIDFLEPVSVLPALPADVE